MLFNEVFGKSFDELQKRMEKFFDLGGDQSFVDDITDFYQVAPELTKQLNDSLQAAKDALKAQGSEVFSPNSNNATGGQQNSLKGDIKASLTEDTGSVLAGNLGGLRITACQQLSVLTNQMAELQKIQYNTSFLVKNLPSIDRRLANLELNAIKIKQ